MSSTGQLLSDNIHLDSSEWDPTFQLWHAKAFYENLTITRQYFRTDIKWRLTHSADKKPLIPTFQPDLNQPLPFTHIHISKQTQWTRAEPCNFRGSSWPSPLSSHLTFPEHYEKGERMWTIHSIWAGENNLPGIVGVEDNRSGPYAVEESTVCTFWSGCWRCQNSQSTLSQSPETVSSRFDINPETKLQCVLEIREIPGVDDLSAQMLPADAGIVCLKIKKFSHRLLSHVLQTFFIVLRSYYTLP